MAGQAGCYLVSELSEHFLKRISLELNIIATNTNTWNHGALSTAVGYISNQCNSLSSECTSELYYNVA